MPVIEEETSRDQVISIAKYLSCCLWIIEAKDTKIQLLFLLFVDLSDNTVVGRVMIVFLFFGNRFHYECSDYK